MDGQLQQAHLNVPPTRIRFIRPFTTFVFNPLSRRFAGHLPGFGILEYVGRRSGRTYRTPMNVFRDRDDWIFALTYGSDVQWVKNVLAAGECHLTVRGQTIRLTEPRVFDDPSGRLVPLPVRVVLRLIRATAFLRMSPR